MPATALEKPLLSEEIGKVIETQGIEATRKRFAEIYPSRQDAYNIDVQGLMNLTSAYLRSGNMEVGMAVMEMMITVNIAMLSDAVNTYSPAMAEMQRMAVRAHPAWSTPSGTSRISRGRKPEPAAPT